MTSTRSGLPPAERDLCTIGTACTPFGRFPERSFRDLTREAGLGALDDGGRIGSYWFDTCGTGSFGQVCLTPLVRDGLIAPTINVEGACATATPRQGQNEPFATAPGSAS